MDRRHFLAGSATALCASAAATAGWAPLWRDAFNAATWPGRLSPSAQMTMLGEALAVAMNARNDRAIATTVDALRKLLGNYAGVPEERPAYATPIVRIEPTLPDVQGIFLANYRPWLTTNPWRDPRQSSDRPTVRLRVSLRIAEAFLRYADSGSPDGAPFFAEAKHAFDYMVSIQGPSGVFGYPYIPSGGSPVSNQAARLVASARAQGVELVFNGWIIDDEDTGNINFDNAAVATGLLYAHRLSGNARYLDAARRAGDWAIGRRLVTNFNYNALSGYLLARLYRITRERKYLESAKAVFRYGVFPGQMANGRWFDQHNAKIPYHSIMMRHCAELYLALIEAGDPYATVVKRHAVLGLDNLATVARTFEASNVAERLSMEAFVVGRRVFGDRLAWREAAAIDVNASMSVGRQSVAGQPRPVSEPIALWIAEKAVPIGSGFEFARLSAA